MTGRRNVRPRNADGVDSRPGSCRAAVAASWLPTPRPVAYPWLLFALLGLLLLARRPDDYLHPQFNAEEGTIFFQQAYNDGFLASFFSPTSGYFHLTLRLTAGLACLLPLELAPLMFKLVAFAIQMLPVAYLLATGTASFVTAPLLRIVAAALYVCAPASSGVYLNVLNAQWHLTFAGCLILLSPPRAGGGRRIMDIGVLVLFAFTGPFSVICTPLALWVLWRMRRGRPAGFNVAPIIVITGAALQIMYLVAGSRPGGGVMQYGLPTIAEIFRIVGIQGVLKSVLGRAFMVGNRALFPDWSQMTAALARPSFLLVALHLRNMPLVVLSGLAGASIGGMLLFPLCPPGVWLHPGSISGYYFFATLLVLYSLLNMIERGRWWRRAAVPGLALACAVGVLGDFHLPFMVRTHWLDQVAVFRSLPRGATFFIPIYPQPEWGITLVKKDRTVLPSNFDGLRTTDRRLIASISVALPDSLSGAALFEGVAVDAGAMKAAGGVFLAVDGRALPAATRRPAPVAPPGVEDQLLGESGYTRLVPVAELGPGSHRVQVFALDHERVALLEPGPLVEFSIPSPPSSPATQRSLPLSDLPVRAPP